MSLENQKLKPKKPLKSPQLTAPEVLITYIQIHPRIHILIDNDPNEMFIREVMKKKKVSLLDHE